MENQVCDSFFNISHKNVLLLYFKTIWMPDLTQNIRKIKGDNKPQISAGAFYLS